MIFIVMTTVKTQENADKLAVEIVGSKLAACVQILPPMTSVYAWQGKIECETEHLMLIKTVPEKWTAISDLITAAHPYEIPEIVAIDSENVSEAYSRWLLSELGITDEAGKIQE